MEMRPFVLLPGMVLAVLLIGGPVVGHDTARADKIEGVWNVQVTILSACGPGGVPIRTFPSMIMFMHDGLLTESPGTTVVGPPPLTQRGSPGMGTWQNLGGQHYTAVFTFFRLNPDSTFAGTQRITEDTELSQDADSFTSTGTAETFDTNGALTGTFCNASVATRAQ
jgi:hypothetical protein